MYFSCNNGYKQVQIESEMWIHCVMHSIRLQKYTATKDGSVIFQNNYNNIRCTLEVFFRNKYM